MKSVLAVTVGAFAASIEPQVLLPESAGAEFFVPTLSPPAGLSHSG